MRHFISMTILAACALVLVPAIQAQDCSNWTLWETRGTYALSGSGWMDLSKLNPTLPPGTIPFVLVGAFSHNGQGVGTGWAALNAGGAQLSIEFVNMNVGRPSADCSFSGSYSIKVKELGTTIGPASMVFVIAGDRSALEIFGIQAGTGPGTPIELFHSKRVSMQF